MSRLGMIQLLMGALAIVMLGLGMSLRTADFRRVVTRKRAIGIALAVQMIVLPLAAFALAVGLKLAPAFAAGLLLLAATPGSISTNLYSHVFGGDVALNISLTGLNTFLSAVTLPFLCAWSIAYFSVGAASVPPLMFDKIAEVLAIVFLPVALGMAMRSALPKLAEILDKPVRVSSAALIVIFSVAAILKEWDALTLGFVQIGSAILLLNLLSVAGGYYASRLASLDSQSTTTIAFQVSIHNALLAIYVALVILDEPLMALPAAVYSVTMNIVGVLFGFLRRSQTEAASPMPLGTAVASRI